MPIPKQTRQGSPIDIRHSTDYLHHFVLHYVKPLQDLEWDNAVITQTRFRMGSGGYNQEKILNGIRWL